MVIVVVSIQAQKSMIQTNCPLCGERETIFLSKDELDYARSNHALITKAISHTDKGHVLTLYIDGEGIVRRKYCFEIAEKKELNRNIHLPTRLDLIFDQMLKDSLNQR